MLTAGNAKTAAKLAGKALIEFIRLVIVVLGTAWLIRKSSGATGAPATAVKIRGTPVVSVRLMVSPGLTLLTPVVSVPKFPLEATPDAVASEVLAIGPFPTVPGTPMVTVTSPGAGAFATAATPLPQR